MTDRDDTDRDDGRPRIDFARALRDASRASHHDTQRDTQRDAVDGVALDRHRHLASGAHANHLTGCVSGTFTRAVDTALFGYPQEHGFVADGIAFRGRWVVFLNPVFTTTTRSASRSPWSRTDVREFRGFHRVAARDLRTLTYDRCELAA